MRSSTRSASGELTLAHRLLPELEAGSLLVNGPSSTLRTHGSLGSRSGRVHFVVRGKAGKRLRPIQKLDRETGRTTIAPRLTIPKNLKTKRKDLPDTLELRVVKFRRATPAPAASHDPRC